MPTNPDPTDPRQPPRRQPPRRQEQPRQVPPGWKGYPAGFNPSRGAPRNDYTRWWRLQPGERGEDGRWVRRGIVHGGTCSRWPTGRNPPTWTYHTKPQVKAMLINAEDFIPCPNCCVGWLSQVWPHEGVGPMQMPTAER